MSTGAMLALDIGTRKVLGLVFAPRPAGVHVVAAARREHAGRAMRDGQIHDVPAVAGVLREVVAELETATGERFPAAYVAAAGRTLQTARGHAEREWPADREVAAAAVRELEWEAVAAAQAALQGAGPAGEPVSGSYCVGHSLVRNWLDGEPIGNLAGQQGRLAAVEVLATFLPRGVVDALEAALAQAGLGMAGLTLEPIAALEAVVAPTMRHLNLALVDVGAGTSDIAITRAGTVHAYAMVPRAGDAVTEALAGALLLDFAVAEGAKRLASGGRTTRVADVLGRTREVGPAVLREAAGPAVAGLAQAVAEAVRSANGAAPEAVLLAGGGSLTPGLAAALAAALEVPPERVAVRNRQAVRGVTGGRGLSGPDVITPLGIALLAARTGSLPLVRVQVGERWVRLFQPGRCTVGEALRAAGVPRAAISGRPGPGITVSVNGQVRTFPGGRATPGRVWLDGGPATPETPCPDRSRVTWEPGREGAPAAPLVGALLGEGDWLPLVLNGEPVRVPPAVRVDGRPAALDSPLGDRTEVEVRPCATVAELAALPGVVRLLPGREVAVAVNGRALVVACPERVQVDGRAVGLETALRPGSRVDWEVTAPAVRDALAAAGVRLPAPVEVQVNGCRVPIDPPVWCRRNGAPADREDLLANGDVVEVGGPQDWQPQLHQVLPVVAGELGQGDGRLVLQVNGRPAGFTTPLGPGAVVEVRWETVPAEEVDR